MTMYRMMGIITNVGRVVLMLSVLEGPVWV